MKYMSKILYIIILGIGIILGMFIRSWNGINWNEIEYGSVAEWFSGIGTILAIISSILIFIYSNRAKLKIQTFSNDDNSILELRVMNTGRTTGMYRYWGIKRHTKGKENLMDFSNMRLKEDAHFISLAPGEISSPKIMSVGEMFTSIGFIPQRDTETNMKVDVAILLSDNSLREVTVTIVNGKIKNSDNERIKK